MPNVITGESNEVLPLIVVQDPIANYDFERFRGAHLELTPEQRVQLATLKDGFESFRDNMGDRRKRQALKFKDARAWIFDEKESEWPFTLNNICEALRISATAIRKRCRELERQHGKGVCIKKADGRRVAA